MDENRLLARKDARRRVLIAWAASLAIHAAFFTLLFSLSSIPPGDPPRLMVSLQGFQAEASADGASEPRSARTPSRAAALVRAGTAAIGPSAMRDTAGGKAAEQNASQATSDNLRRAAIGREDAETQSGPPGEPAGAAANEGSVGATARGGTDGAFSSAAGSAGGGVALAGAPSGALSGYDPVAALAARIDAAVEARKTYPEAARRRGTEGLVRLRLSVAEDGSLITARLVESSGSPLLDRAALDLIASVFPVNNDARREFDDLYLSIHYGLKR
jgi:TonB family protein